MKKHLFMLFAFGVADNVYAQENKPTGESFCIPAVKHSPIDQSVCNGGSVTFYSDAAIAVGPFYTGIWKTKQTNSSEWVTIPGSLNDTLTIFPLTEDLNNSKYIRVFTSPCNWVTVSDTATLTVIPCTHWTGDSNSDWNNEQNWNNGVVPDNNTNVYVGEGKANYPAINTNIFCKSIYLRPSASIKINSGGNLIITGNNH